MISFIARRLATMVFTMICLTLVVFYLVNLEPNLKKLALAQTNSRASQAEIDSWLDRNGYRDPFLKRYAEWIGVWPKQPARDTAGNPIPRFNYCGESAVPQFSGVLQGDFGMLTYYMRKVGLLAQNGAVLSVPELVFPTIVAIDVWQWTPFVTLVMLAGMMSLPRAPFEAAMMDGARPFQIFRDVMLPLLRPVIALVLLLRGIDAFKEFDKVFLMTGGGPGTLTELVSIYAYRVNFRNWDLGYGAAVAFMIYLVVLILCSVFYKAVYWSNSKPASAF